MLLPLSACLLLSAPAAPAPELVAENGVVTARRGGKEIWQNVHDRRGHFRQPDRPGSVKGPIAIGGSVYYGVAASLYEVSAETGVVLQRTTLPDAITGLAREGEGVAVTVASSQESLPWTRTYEVGAGAPPVPFFFSGNLLAGRLPSFDAENVLRDVMAESPGKPQPATGPEWRRRPDMRPHLEKAVAELAALAERDASNPFYRYWRGVYLRDLGREEEASAAFRSVLSGDPTADFELLALALRLDEVAPALGQEAFRRGLKFLLDHGYEPEMMGPIICVLVYYGSPHRDEPVDTNDLERIRLLGERMWDLAPNAEFVTAMFNGIAELHRGAGQAEQEALWRARSEAAMPYRLFGFVGSALDWLGPSLNLLVACPLAVLGCLVVKGLRGLKGLPRRHWNPMRYWTRGETLGVLVLLLLIVPASRETARGVGAIGRAAAMPIGALAGNFGHPSGVAYVAQLAGSPGGDFVHALALHKAGDLDGAAAIYARLGDPRSKNNLGVAEKARGRDAEARTLFAAARAADPTLGEAAFNLGEAGSGTRVERARKYGLAGPLLAMPTPAIWTEALETRMAPWRVFDVFTLVQQLASLDGPSLPAAAAVESGHVLAGLYLLVLLAAISALVTAPTTPPRSSASVAGWVLGFLVPGTARSLGVLGPLVLGAAIFSFVVHYSLAGSAGMATNPVEAIALPSLQRAYGIGVLVFTPIEMAVRKTAALWWVLWLANLVAAGVLEWRKADPLGPRSQS